MKYYADMHDTCMLVKTEEYRVHRYRPEPGSYTMTSKLPLAHSAVHDTMLVQTNIDGWLPNFIQAEEDTDASSKCARCAAKAALIKRLLGFAKTVARVRGSGSGSATALLLLPASHPIPSHPMRLFFVRDNEPPSIPL